MYKRPAQKVLSLLLSLTLLLGLLPSTAFASTPPAAPFTASTGETRHSVARSDTDYSYTVVTEYDENWNPVKTEERSVDLYVVRPDTEVVEVTLDFGGEERIAYSYDANGNYLGACGDYGNGTVGQTTATVTDLTSFVRVQTPYDANWQSEFLYAVSFDVPEGDTPAAPFTASTGETRHSVARSDTDYSYTVVTEYDENWNPVKTEERSVDLYVVRPDTEVVEVTLDFGGEERIAYSYDANGNYLGACGDYGDGTVGQTTATVTDLTSFVRVQTPYDANWQSEFLYAVSFDVPEGDTPAPGPSAVSIEALLTNIAAGYVETSENWVILDMAAYEDTVSDAQSKTSDTAKQAYIDAAIASVTTEGAGETDYAKAILSLQAIGADPQQLYPEGTQTAVNAVHKLTACAPHGASAWVAPYTLAALNQGDYGTEAAEQAILTAVLANQAENGSWSEWGDSIQTTANLLAGLAFYYGRDDAATAAVDKAVSFLSQAQKEDGSFDPYGSGADSNTMAMVVIGLSALGIDPDTDPRFVKNETSALDALLTFALADNSGFGYSNNTTLNGYSTEQAFRALVAANAVAQTGTAYNVYDFSANEVSPAYASGYNPGGGSSGGSTGGGTSSDTIKVTFTLKTHQTVWIDGRSVTVSEDATVGDLLYAVRDLDSKLSFVDRSGYVSSITYGDTTWAEFDAGPNSGWKYTVNGAAPEVGMNDCALESGDTVTWYYVTDYATDPTPNRPVTPSKPQETDPTETPETPETPEPEKPSHAFTDVAGHWAADAIAYAYEHGLMAGTSAATFEPETTGSRGMLVTILHKLDGNPDDLKPHAFPDVTADAYYANAISWAVSGGIVAGYGNGTFGPNDDVTREQLAVILLQYARFKGYDVSARADLSAFVDADEVSDWARDGMEWACGQGLMVGKGGKVLDPGGNATRAEMATVLMHFAETVAK